MIDLRVVVPAAAAWLAAILFLPFPGWILPVAVVTWAAAVLSVVVARITSRPLLVVAAVSAAAIALVATSALATSPARRPTVLTHGSHQLTAASIVTTQTVTTSSEYFAATLVVADGHAMSVPVLVFDGDPARRVEIGTMLHVTGSLQATSPADETSFLVFARAPADVVAPPPWYLSWANGLRAGFARAATSLPGDGGALLPGLAIGDTTAVSTALSDSMKTSSLSHTKLYWKHGRSDLHQTVIGQDRRGSRCEASARRVQGKGP